MPDIWAPLDSALDDLAARDQQVDLWWRDDDAVTPTAALDRLTALSRRYEVPLLLAVIPEPADRLLATFVANESNLTPTQHGFAHTNHAGLLHRACELGARPRDIVLGELAKGRDKMDALFGNRATDILVPPWNRIAPELLEHLSGLGFGGLSTFADQHTGAPNLDIVNCTLDIIDWRNGRRCHRHDKLVDRLAASIHSGRPVGLLTHHLVHDEDAWQFLEDAFTRLSNHPQVRITTAESLRQRQ